VKVIGIADFRNAVMSVNSQSKFHSGMDVAITQENARIKHGKRQKMDWGGHNNGLKTEKGVKQSSPEKKFP
jgi:hypothetical protein